MSVYVIVDLELKDAAHAGEFAEYAERTNALLHAAGAKVIAFDATPKILEGSWKPRMVVVQEYPNMAALESVYNSESYAPLKALRHRIADTHVIAVHGAEAPSETLAAAQ